KEQEIELEYAFALPDWIEAESHPADHSSRPDHAAAIAQPRLVRRFALPLVQPMRATSGETKVRFWCDSSDQPASAGGPWEELPTEIVAERESLPALVTQGGLDRSLSLVVTRSPLASIAGALIERILVRAELTESGLQSYRAKFLVSQLNARQLDIDLPALLPRASVEAHL